MKISVELLSSKFEIHFNKFCNVKEVTTFNEMTVSVNGPLPSKSDQVAMEIHFKRFDL